MGCGCIFGPYLCHAKTVAVWFLITPQPLDLTLLDAHFGNITLWQEAIQEIHSRGMYVVMDNTMAT